LCRGQHLDVEPEIPRAPRQGTAPGGRRRLEQAGTGHGIDLAPNVLAQDPIGAHRLRKNAGLDPGKDDTVKASFYDLVG
jgi:hypothetical protein